ncbi:MAG TPA: alcohol dehydrogenase catalytic domain-containing protein [Ignavibacteriaceae bacterium]|nr:alcohol dehydrogenase catalytic domain-containing protein [Ignavibacteriaceae bacterium]
MKTADLIGIRKFQVIEKPKPGNVKDNEVLLQIKSVGVCGSDLHYFNEGKIGDQIINFPFTIGHECSGVVEKTGKNVKKVKTGDLVAVEPLLVCHKCEQCLKGREHTCLRQKFLGCPGQASGCLSEYLIMPEENCFKVPENFSSELAALVEPLSIAYYTVNFLKDFKRMSSIAILGVGPIGLGVLSILKTFGFNTIAATDKLDYRLDAALKAGAVFSVNADKEDVISALHKKFPESFDAVIECCGKQEALDQAVDLLKPGGLLLIVGIPEEDYVSFNISKLRRKEITIQNVRRQNNSIKPVIDLIASGKLDPEFMITHKYGIKDTGKAFKTVSEYKDGVIKAVIKF